MIWELSFKFFKYFIENKIAFYKYFILSFIVGLLELTGVAATYPFVSKLLSQDQLTIKTAFLGGLIILAFLTKNFFMIFYSALQISFIKICEANISKKFMKFFIYGDYNIVSKISFAQKNQIINFLNSTSINNFLLRLLNLNVNIFIFILIVGFLFTKFFVATCVTLISSIIILFLQFAFFKNRITNLSNKLNKAIELLSTSSNQPLLNLKNIKIAKTENYFYNNYSKELEDTRLISKKLSFYNTIPPYVTEPLIIFLLLILLTIISLQNISNTSNLVASYALIVSATFRLAPTISRIQTNITGINSAIPQVKELIMYYEEFHLDKFAISERNLQTFNSSVELKNINFAYDKKQVLKNIDFKIKKGEFIGIAGPSGVGKTTLIDIISGLLKFNSGEIYIDDKLFSNTQMPSLKIGYIPQEYCIISESIRENVAFGEFEIDDERVIKALKDAQLYDYIQENFKNGIYAKPFVDSTGFSLGQKQRLAIARALYSNPDIIIMDEATSSLDLETESEICNTLNKLKGKKTIIAIAHRISTIKNADTIYYLQNSSIVDKGAFNKLCLKNEDFKKLVELNNANLV